MQRFAPSSAMRAALCCVLGVLGAGAQASDFDGLDFSFRVPEGFGMPERSVHEGAPTVSFRSGRENDAESVFVRVAVTRVEAPAEPESDAALLAAADKHLEKALAAL